MKIKIAATILFLATLSPAFGGDATGVGHGDVLDQFLGATRMSLIESLRSIIVQPDTEKLCECSSHDRPQFFCKFLQTLTQGQRDYCSDFLRAIAPAIVQLNTVSPITPFTLTDKPILDLDPHAHQLPVSAMTPLGPLGQITFAYDSIRSLAPSYLLALMGHEFGHKAKPFNFSNYVGDNDALGVFNFPGGGRMLMDSIGVAISLFASRNKIIGNSFSLKDVFQCRISEKNSSLSFSSTGTSERLFRGDNYSVYETGVSNSPQAFYCEIQQGTDQHFYFRVQIHEERGCTNPASATERWTEFEILRTSGTESATPISLLTKTIPRWNPICGDDPAQVIQLEYHANAMRDYLFQVQYRGSVGTTIP